MCLIKPHCGAYGDHGCVSADKGEGRTEESRNLHLGEKVEEEGADTGEEEGCAYGQTRESGDQDSGAEHGEHVLEAQNQHFRTSKGAGVIDRVLLCHTRIVKSILGHKYNKSSRLYIPGRVIFKRIVSGRNLRSHLQLYALSLYDLFLHPRRDDGLDCIHHDVQKLLVDIILTEHQ